MGSTNANGSGTGGGGDGSDDGRPPRRVMTVVVETRQLVIEQKKMLEAFWKDMHEDLVAILDQLKAQDALVRDTRNQVLLLRHPVQEPPKPDGEPQ